MFIAILIIRTKPLKHRIHFSGIYSSYINTPISHYLRKLNLIIKFFRKNCYFLVMD